MDVAWLAGLGVLLLVCLVCALAFDTLRKRGENLPFTYPDTTTRLLDDTAIQTLLKEAVAGPAPHKPKPARQLKAPSLGRLPRIKRTQRNRTAPRLLSLPAIPARAYLVLAACLALALLGLGAYALRAQNASLPPGSIVVGICPFVGAPPKSEPTDTFVPDLLQAANAGGLPNLVTRISRTRAAGAAQAELERNTLKADFLIWGDVGPSGDLTVNVSIAPGFLPASQPWQRWTRYEPQALVLPAESTVRLPASVGTNPLVPLSLALAHYRAGHTSEAIRAAHGAQLTIEQAGGSGSIAALLEADASSISGDYASANGVLSGLQAREALSPEGWISYAFVRIQNADPQGTLAALDHVLGERDSSDRVMARAHMLKGRALYRIGGDLTAALAEINESIRLDPPYLPALLDKAEVLYRQSQPDAARAELQTLLKAAPDAAPASRLLGLTWLMLGKPAEALQALQQANDTYARWLEALHREEGSAQAAGDQTGSQAANEGIVVLNRELAGVYLYKGMAQADQAKKQPPESFLGSIWRRIRGEKTPLETALTSMQEAARLDPHRADVQMQIGTTYAAVGNTEKAAEAFGQAQALDPASQEPSLALARLQESQGSPREAVKTLETLVARQPAAYEAYAQMYNTLLKVPDKEAANAALQRALAVPARSANDHLWHGKFLHLLGRNTDAIGDLQAATADPSLPDAHLLLGQVFLDVDRNPEALAEFQAVLQTQANEPSALLNAGRLLVLAGRPDEAGTLFARLVDTSPSNVEGHLAYAQLLIAKGDLARALEEGKKAVQIAPDRPDTYYTLGEAYEAQRNWSSASEQYQAAAGRDHNSFDAFIRLAVTRFREDRYLEGVEAAKEAIRLRPGDAQAYRWRAESELALREPDAALQSLGSALQLLPQFPEALALAARAYSLKGDATSGIAYATKAAAQDVRNPAGLLALGDVYLAAGRDKEALQAFKGAADLAPNGTEPIVGQGRAEASTDNKEQALALFAQAGKLDKQDSSSHFYAGQVYRELGRWTEAQREYADAVRIRPNWPEALYYLGQTYLQRKDLQSAQQAFEAATKYSPNLVEGWFALGITLRDRGHPQEATVALLRATALNHNYAGAWLYLGLSYEELGDRQHAAEAFNTAAATSTDQSTKQQAEQGLQRVR